ncbi:hypothetical protein B0H21DRAFT_424082 [Amylocystis lapponica]|nr:hypothetical protein B0H21DRAFT_424082 [Amylocystis lapponica]
MAHTPPGIAHAKSVLIIGATSGIGRALAQSIKALSSKPTVIVAGRRKERLAELAKDDFQTVQFDVTAGRDALQTFAHDVVAKYPDLDAVIFASGIQRLLDFAQPDKLNLDQLEDEFNTNYISVATLITFFLPHFLKLSEQGRPSFLVPITSGLGITPAPWVPNYSATKAALHSLALSLHFQLQHTNVHVMEIIPPLVESELHDQQGTTPMLSKLWMPLDEYTNITMEGLLRGDLAIPAGRSAESWEVFEKDKLPHIAASLKAFRK